MIKAIVFDVDGVLIDCVDENGEFCWQKTIEEDLGIPAEIVTEKFFVKYWPEIGSGKMDTLEALSLFLDQVGADMSAMEFMNYWFEKDSKINQQVHTLANELNQKGFRIFVGTNQEKYRLKHLSKLLNEHGIFEEFFASSTIGYGKPDPNFFKIVAEKMNLNPSEIFFIDDSLKNVEVARSLRWNAHHFTSVESLNTEIQKFI